MIVKGSFDMVRGHYNLAKQAIVERWQEEDHSRLWKTSDVAGGGYGRNKGLKKIRATQVVV